MSAVALFWPCGPPALTMLGSWNGLSHVRFAGSGTHTLAGRPSAPGYVPKYVSKDRFSCMITTTCLILWMPVAPAGFVAGLVEPGPAPRPAVPVPTPEREHATPTRLRRTIPGTTR